MPYARPEALVGTEWLAAHLADPHVRIADASFKLPGITPTAREDYDRAHIPGAVFFDIDDICEPGTSLPHMIPSPGLFAQKVGALGIGGADRVVVYDSAGLSSAGRAWWMLRKSADDLRELFADAGVALDRPIAASCGSGVTACALAFALHLIGHPGAAVYDGSWSEWGLPGDTPVETGPAR